MNIPVKLMWLISKWREDPNYSGPQWEILYTVHTLEEAESACEDGNHFYIEVPYHDKGEPNGRKEEKETSGKKRESNSGAGR